MSTTNTLPTGEIERLIDQRLDTIDRALLGLIPRQDRLSIVTQVEARLHELAGASGLSGANSATNLQEQATVAEAHFGDADGSGPARRRGPSARRKQSRLALSSGVLG